MDDIKLHNMMTNSYKNFHAKGLDYICVKRTCHHTQKVYFFNDNISDISEIVAPHNHRYSFETRVLCGELYDRRYVFCSEGEVFNLFSWDTPLNGGDGFKWLQESKIRISKEVCLKKGFVPYATNFSDLHTIQVAATDTVILLDQWHDEISDDEPTFTLTKKKEPPSLDGLYEKFTPDELLKYLKKIEQLGISIENYTKPTPKEKHHE